MYSYLKESCLYKAISEIFQHVWFVLKKSSTLNDSHSRGRKPSSRITAAQRKSRFGASERAWKALLWRWKKKNDDDGGDDDDDAVRSMTKRQLVRSEPSESVNTQRWELIHRLPDINLPQSEGSRAGLLFKLHRQLNQRVPYTYVRLDSLRELRCRYKTRWWSHYRKACEQTCISFSFFSFPHFLHDIYEKEARCSFFLFLLFYIDIGSFSEWKKRKRKRKRERERDKRLTRIHLAHQVSHITLCLVHAWELGRIESKFRRPEIVDFDPTFARMSNELVSSNKANITLYTICGVQRFEYAIEILRICTTWSNLL